MFTLFGHEDVRLIDGGRDGGSPKTARPPPEMPRHRAYQLPTPDRSDAAIRAFRDDVPDHLGGGPRWSTSASPQEYTGELTHMTDYPEEGAQRAGHVPTAVDDPLGQSRLPDGRFRTGVELDKMYGCSASPPTETWSPYCRIGERSSRTWFVLTHLLGFETCATTTAPGPSGATRCGCRSSGEDPRRGPGPRMTAVPAPLAGNCVEDLKDVTGQQKLQLLLEFGGELPPLPADLEQAAMEPVPECQSPLFLPSTPKTATACGCSSARRRRRRRRVASPRSCAGLDQQRAHEILDVPYDFYTELGLAAWISPLRLRGMSAMLTRIKRHLR